MNEKQFIQKIMTDVKVKVAELCDDNFTNKAYKEQGATANLFDEENFSMTKQKRFEKAILEKSENETVKVYFFKRR